jgi:2-dehydropantoate 2-reductase
MASTDKQVRVAVVGAGAVGSYFGGMLARSGVPVTLIARAAHVEAIRANKLFIDAVTFQERVAVNASTEISAARDADVILFCVKMTDTEEAARSLAPYLAPNAIVVSLQNGVDNVPRIRAATGIDALAAVVYIAAAMPEPGHVKHSGAGSLAVGEQVDRGLVDRTLADRKPADRELADRTLADREPADRGLVDGKPADRNSPSQLSAPPPAGRAERISALFTAAGVPCRVSPDIEADMWSKFVMNCAGNAVTGITQISYTSLAHSAITPDIFKLVIGETVAVARAAGVKLPEVDYVSEGLKFLQGVGAGATSSTAQDLARGKRTEIDSLNGYVARRGKELGIATPANLVLFALVKLLEEKAADQQPASSQKASG